MSSPEGKERGIDVAPRVSAVIPTYNRGQLISRAIESILGQTRQPDEIIVVDDGSTDDTRQRVERYLDRITYVRQDNEGSSAARNRGVAEAAHPWIAFLDSDDYWRAEHLERMEAAIVDTKGAAGFYFGDTLGSASEGGRPFWEMSGIEVEGRLRIVEDASEWVMLSLQPMMLQSSVIRRRDYLEVGGLDARVTLRHDTLIFFQLGLGRPACAVAGAGAIMTADDSSGARLTSAHSDQTLRYWHDTVLLYSRLISEQTRLSGAQRRTLRARLAVAHLRLAREAALEGRYREAITRAAKGWSASPRIFGDRLIRRLRVCRRPNASSAEPVCRPRRSS